MALEIARVFKMPLDRLFQYPDGGAGVLMKGDRVQVESLTGTAWKPAVVMSYVAKILVQRMFREENGSWRP
jgi:hypothetical protein